MTQQKISPYTVATVNQVHTYHPELVEERSSMSKRKSKEMQPPGAKQPCSSKPATQSTLHNFFKSCTGDNKAYPRTLKSTPQLLGIHMYSAEDISSSTGLDKDYKEFWNVQAIELCANEDVRHKLKDKLAIQGAINTSWTLHKSSLLELQAEQLTISVHQAYSDDAAAKHILSSVESNKKKMMELTNILQLACNDATEDEVSEHMKELRKVQSALKKAIDYKTKDLCSIPQSLRASSPENLSPHEVENIVQEIVMETSYEADPTTSTSQKLNESIGLPELEMAGMDSPHSIVSDSTNSRSRSPVIPILAGLDTYK